MKKLRVYSFAVAVIMIIALILPVSADNIEAVRADDGVIDTIFEFFDAVGVEHPDAGGIANTSMTRGEFADLIYSISVGSSEDAQAEEVQDDGWLWRGDSAGDSEDGKAAYFYDVPPKSAYSDSVEYVAKAGYMTGSGDGYFRPSNTITGTECIKVFCSMLGADFRTDKPYPVNYIEQARKSGLIKNLDIKDYSSNISVRDVWVMLFNALNAEIYSTSAYSTRGFDYTRDENCLLMSVLFDMYRTEGIMDSTRYVSLAQYAKSADDSVTVNGDRFITPDHRYDFLAGYNVKAYYSDVKGEPKTLVYAEKSNNKELSISADDIDSYKKPVLTYFVNNAKKSVSVRGNEKVIYNENIINDYNDSIFTPINGSVTFVDNNSDGTYECIRIDSYEVVFTDSINYSEKKISDKYSDKTYDFHDSECKVYNSSGTETVFGEINEDMVIEIKRTLDTQDSDFAEIYISDGAVTGSVGTVNSEYLKIDGVRYDISKTCSEKFEISDYGVFYLTRSGKIAGFAHTQKDYACYAYLMAADKGKGLEDKKDVKVYTENMEFKVHGFAKNVKLNGTKTKDENAFEFLCPDGVAEPQLIYYSVNANGDIVSVDTADANPNGFVSKQGVSAAYKSNIKAMQSAKGTLYFIDANTKRMIVPRTDKTNEKMYDILTTYVNDYSYKADRLYFPKKGSAVADIILEYVDAEQINVIDSVITPLTLVNEVNKTVDNGDTIYVVSGYQRGASVSFKCKNTSLYSVVESLKIGDAIRVENNPLGYMKTCVKVYDITTHKLVGSKENSYISQGGGNLVQQPFYLMHGVGYDNAEESKIIRIMPYDYKNADNLQPDTDENNLLMFDGSLFTVMVCDTTSRDGSVLIYTDTYKNIVMQQAFGKGDEVLVYTRYSDARDIIIIR